MGGTYIYQFSRSVKVYILIVMKFYIFLNRKDFITFSWNAEFLNVRCQFFGKIIKCFFALL